MPTSGTTTQRGYGQAYQVARKRLLESGPLCHWCGTAPATTADHEPPLEVVGRPHLNLVPACGPCNFGRRRRREPLVRPSREW